MTVSSVGLNPNSLELDSTEAVAGVLRRAASFLCPCSSRTLIKSVNKSLEGLVSDEVVAERIDETLQALIAYGDIREFEDIDDAARNTKALLLYTAPPSFLQRGDGALFLVGITPDNATPLPEDIQRLVQHRNHVRWIPGESGNSVRIRLERLGFVQISSETWLDAPHRESAINHDE